MAMPKEEIIGMVLEMYDARKEAKDGYSSPYSAVGEQTNQPLSLEYDLLHVAPQCQ